MLSDSKILVIVLDLADPFDYASFVTACTAEEVRPLSADIYAQKLGMLFVAMRVYPSMAVKDAYLTFIRSFHRELETTESPSPVDPPVTVTKPCGTCGGGKVR